MHKRLLNEATIELVIEPDGPILIKAGDTGADPTRPDMEFVRTIHPNGERTVYLPGSSLKGMLRAHCERIVRSLQGEAAACNPFGDESCSQKLKQDMDGVTAYNGSCVICRLFGNTVVAGHLRTADAYPEDPTQVKLEERNGVAIDRIFGSVAVGPFNFEVAIGGKFKTRLALHNFSLAQLALVGLALRDLKLGRVSIGFGKSRGLGRVKVDFEQMSIRYPACTVEEGQVAFLTGQDRHAANQLGGVGHLSALADYEYPGGDKELVSLPDGLAFTANDWLEAVLITRGDQVEDVWRACIPAWQEAMSL